MFLHKSDIDKTTTTAKNGRDAGHRISEWGCTKTTIFNENLSKNTKKQEIRVRSTIEICGYF